MSRSGVQISFRAPTLTRVVDALAGRDIEVIDYGGSSGAQSWFRCLVEGCGHEWPTTASSVLGGTGCSGCVGGVALSDDEIRSGLGERQVDLVEYGGNANSQSRFRCLADGCDCEWPTTLSAVRGGTGCPSCAVAGFDPSAPALVYLIKHVEFGALKIGVAGVDSDRLGQHRRKGWELIASWTYEVGADAKLEERTVLDQWKADGLPVGFLDPSDMPQRGETETTSLTMVDLEALMASIDSRHASTI